MTRSNNRRIQVITFGLQSEALAGRVTELVLLANLTSYERF